MPTRVNDSIYDSTDNGAYSVSDYGCVGDQFAVSPTPYPVPGYLKAFETWRRAVDESIDTCALQQGRCWVIKRSDTLPRCGQRCGRGECLVRGRVSPGFAGAGLGMIAALGSALAPDQDVDSVGTWLQGMRDREFFAFKRYPDAVRRAVAARWSSEISNWSPLAEVSENGVAPVIGGCVLPIWRRVFYVGDQNNQFTRAGDPMLYRAAVNAAMLLARTQGRPRVIFGARGDRVVPVVYVHPGGIVRAVPRARGPETVVRQMTPYEVRQQMAASRGASILPFGV